MKKILLGIGALVLGLSFAGEASAHGPDRSPFRPGRSYRDLGRFRDYPWRSYLGPTRSYPRDRFVRSPYYEDHGVRFRGGYYFKGRGHDHWAHRVWSPVYRRYHYYEPDLRCYYYYCPRTCCFLPVPCH